ncbi:2-oxoacid:acceptor oxidoreductase family protein [Peptoniphilaceae bacterium SGI.137]|nr:2-oxoacid:acceptor oxidoreductase family protein [Peptoniphilaceae bacterium]
MREIRFHGKGGQGVVKSAQLLVKSVVDTGSYAHFIPSFGVERKGSPVHGFYRQDDSEILAKTQIEAPDAIVVYDDSLFKNAITLEGLNPEATIIVNTRRSLTELQEEAKLPKEFTNVYGVNATDIAEETIKRDIPSTVMLGAYAKVLDGVDWETLKTNIGAKFGTANIEAAQQGYDSVTKL